MKFVRFAWCLWLLFAASTCLAQMYTITDLGSLGGNSNCSPTAINSSGQVVGICYVAGIGHAFRTAPNSPINPATDDLGLGSASGINASGQVVGFFTVASVAHAFRTAPNSPINPATDDLGLGYATGINASGQVVGYFNVSGIRHAFRTAPNSPINPTTDDLDSPGVSNSYASGINASGQVVGNADFPGYPMHPFRTGPNSPINPATDDLNPWDYTGGWATTINASGQAGGAFLVIWFNPDGSWSCGQLHAFRTAPNSPINPATDDLTPCPGYTDWSQASAIDSYGQVLGWYFPRADFFAHGFLYSGGVLHDLAEIVDGGWQVYQPSGMNDAGQIVALVSQGYVPLQPVLLNPIYKGLVQQPINADGSSVFSAKRGVVPVKFAVTQYGFQPSCTLPATLAITRTGNGTLTAIDESIYSSSADSGSNFRIDSTACQYVYNLGVSSLGVGTYRVDISINGIMVGHAVFALK